MSQKSRSDRRASMAKSIDYWRKHCHELQLIVEQLRTQRNQAINAAEHWNNMYLQEQKK